METTLQVEYTKAISGTIPLTLFYDDNFSLVRWLSWLLDHPNPLLVHILSYILMMIHIKIQMNI